VDNIELQVEQLFIAHDKSLVSLAYELRDFFRNTTQPKFELIGQSVSSVNIGYGFTGKAWDSYCAIITYSKHINISFPSGALLIDPDNILIGTGKRVRNIRIVDMSILNEPGVIQLIKSAKELAQSTLDEHFVFDAKIHPILRLKSSTKN